MRTLPITSAVRPKIAPGSLEVWDFVRTGHSAILPTHPTMELTGNLESLVTWRSIKFCSVFFSRNWVPLDIQNFMEICKIQQPIPDFRESYLRMWELPSQRNTAHVHLHPLQKDVQSCWCPTARLSDWRKRHLLLRSPGRGFHMISCNQANTVYGSSASSWEDNFPSDFMQIWRPSDNLN